MLRALIEELQISIHSLQTSMDANSQAKNQFPPSPTTLPDLCSFPSTLPPSITPTPNPTTVDSFTPQAPPNSPLSRLPIRRLSPAKIEELNDHGLCYNCEQIWSDIHRCRSQCLILFGTEEEDEFDDWKTPRVEVEVTAVEDLSKSDTLLDYESPPPPIAPQPTKPPPQSQIPNPNVHPVLPTRFPDFQISTPQPSQLTDISPIGSSVFTESSKSTNVPAYLQATMEGFIPAKATEAHSVKLDFRSGFRGPTKAASLKSIPAQFHFLLQPISKGSPSTPTLPFLPFHTSQTSHRSADRLRPLEVKRKWDSMIGYNSNRKWSSTHRCHSKYLALMETEIDADSDPPDTLRSTVEDENIRRKDQCIYDLYDRNSPEILTSILSMCGNRVARQQGMLGGESQPVTSVNFNSNLLRLIMELARNINVKHLSGDAQGDLLLLVTFAISNEVQVSKYVQKLLDSLSFLVHSDVQLSRVKSFTPLLQHLFKGLVAIQVIKVERSPNLELGGHDEQCLSKDGELKPPLLMLRLDDIVVKLVAVRALENIWMVAPNGLWSINAGAKILLFEFLFCQVLIKLRDHVAKTITNLAMSTTSPETTEDYNQLRKSEQDAVCFSAILYGFVLKGVFKLNVLYGLYLEHYPQNYAEAGGSLMFGSRHNLKATISFYVEGMASLTCSVMKIFRGYWLLHLEDKVVLKE